MANQGGSHDQHGKSGQQSGKSQEAQHASGVKRDQPKDMQSKGGTPQSSNKGSDQNRKRDH